MATLQKLTTADLPHIVLERFESELEAARLVHENRLNEAPEPNDIAIALQRRSRDAHTEVTDALARIRVGSFGVCELCDGLIAIDRLEAMPHTRYCVVCIKGR